MTVHLSLAGIGKRYGDAVAVEEFSLDIEQGEFISLLGPSGCGKTTMLRMIAGFITPSKGTIRLNGETISSPEAVVPPERRGMSMIFQSYAIWPNMTVEENVRFGLEVRKVPAKEAKRRVDAMLDVVRLSALAGRYPAELSGGQQQRVALARAVVVEPSVLLLDEPLSNLDANLREEMRFEIRRMHDAYRITTVYVTHDQSEAMVTSNRIVVMNHGRVEQVDSPVRLYEAPHTRFVASFIGKTNLLEGTKRGDLVTVGGVSLPTGALGMGGARDGEVTLSLRPQHVDLLVEADPGAGEAQGKAVVPGRVIDAAYLGGFWEYTVDLGMGVPILAVSHAAHVFAKGQDVRAAIALSRVAVVGAP
ncbi:MAG: ABC transporter ATP-binding protein [Burkholderiales bacterium]